MKRKRFSEEQIIGVLKEAEAGAKTADLARRHGVSEATIYNWKSKYGGLEVGEDMAQPREAPDDFRPTQRRAVTVLNVGGVDHGVDQIAFGVGEDMALAALDLLARVIAPRAAAFRAFHALAVGPLASGGAPAGPRPRRGRIPRMCGSAASTAVLAPLR